MSHCVGPERVAGKWVFLCPVCDSQQVSESLEAPTGDVLCTAIWLEGEFLRGDSVLGDRTCYCFETDPFDGEPNATDQQRRFFHYRCISYKLSASRQRVDLPACVKKRIEDRWGQSTTGFTDPDGAENA